MSIHKFCDWWNSPRPGWGNERYAELVAQAAKASYLKQFVKREPHPVGLSQIGKPLIELLYSSFEDEEEIECSLRYIFTIGDYTEALLIAMMKSFGLNVHSEQLEVEYRGVYGHIDCMVDNRLIEIKSMSHTYWTNFTNSIDDERGYVTQLSLYARATQSVRSVESAGWLCLNKSTGNLKYVKLSKQVIKPTLISSARKIKALDKALAELDEESVNYGTNPIDWIKENIQPPHPEPEKKNRVYTGKLLIPKIMAYAKSKYIAYPSSDGIYVDRVEWERRWGDYSNETN